jgi:hypothetical protein
MGWPGLLYNRHCGLRPWGQGSGGMMKTTHFHLVMSLRMGAAVLLILLDVFMAWTWTALPLYLYHLLSLPYPYYLISYGCHRNTYIHTYTHSSLYNTDIFNYTSSDTTTLLLQQIISGFSIFNELAPISQFLQSTYHSPLNLFFSYPLVLTPIGFQSVVFLTSFISSILLRCPHHFILYALIH